MPTINAPQVIPAPFTRGESVLIPAGTILWTFAPGQGPYKLARRAYRVTVHSTNDGHVDVWNVNERGHGVVHLPQIIWPGTSGYWSHAQVTRTLLAANGKPVPALPTRQDLIANGPTRYDAEHKMVCDPSFDFGYTDEWTDALLARASA